MAVAPATAPAKYLDLDHLNHRSSSTPSSQTHEDPSASTSFLWKNLFSRDKSSTTSHPPSLPDGTPVIIAPPDILLHASAAWSGYVLCQFFGETPSPAKIFTDLNPIWGRFGKISVRKFTEDTCLVLIPSLRTRKWVLESCLWSAGTVAFAVTEWSSSPNFVTSSLTHAPVWLTLRELPPQLWTEAGAKLIGERFGQLIPSSRVVLPPESPGMAKIRIILPLQETRPKSVIVQDSKKNQVRVQVEFGRLPPLCPMCKDYGHQQHRCPSRHRSLTTTDVTVSIHCGANLELEKEKANPNPTLIHSGPFPSKPISHLSSDDPSEPIISSSPLNLNPTSPKSAPDSFGPNSLNLSPNPITSQNLNSPPPSRRDPLRSTMKPRRRSSSPPCPPTVESASYDSDSPLSSTSHRLLEDPSANASTSSLIPPLSAPLESPELIMSLNPHIPSNFAPAQISLNPSSPSEKSSPISPNPKSSDSQPPAQLSLRPSYQKSQSQFSLPTQLPPVETYNSTPPVIKERVKHLTQQQFAEEEELIAISQLLKRTTKGKYPSSSERKLAKQKRRLQRKKALESSEIPELTDQEEVD